MTYEEAENVFQVESLKRILREADNFIEEKL